MEAIPAPVSLPALLTALIGLVNDLQRKNTTMINYYVHPQPLPTEIAEYEPRLFILRGRLQKLAEINSNVISGMVDDASALLAAYVRPTIEQLAASSVGIQKIFIEHYDRRLEQSLPYETIFHSLNHYQQSLHQYMAFQMNNPRRQPAEHFLPPASATLPSLCRGAIAFLNNRDQAKISSVKESDLLPPHRSRLADRGGVILWWECQFCAFRLRYHASNSISLNINQTDEILIEDDVDDIAYRSAWLAKCHIYHPRREPPPAPSPPTSPRPNPNDPDKAEPALPIRIPKPNQRPQHAPKRVSFSRRRSSSSHVTITTTTTRILNRSPSPPLTPTASKPSREKSKTDDKDKSNSKKKRGPPPDPSGPGGLRYYCPFCVAKGKPMVGRPHKASGGSGSGSGSETDTDSSRDPPPDPTCFKESKDFMEHIDNAHNRDRPVALLLQKLKVAVRGQMAPGPEAARGRWDLDLR